MRRLLSAILLLLGHSTANAAPAKPTTPPPTPAVVPDKADFTAKLHGQLASKAGNLFYSPLSIRMAMAMAQAGAVGETATEMETVLGWGANPAEPIAKLRADWKALADPPMPSWGQNDPQMQKYAEAEVEKNRLVLRVVNRLWGEKERKLKEPFQKNLSDHYGAPLELLDFKHAADPSRITINKWVADQTEQKIKDLIPPGTVSSDTKLVITNAVYFKAQWSKQFQKNITKDDAFHTPSGVKKAPMMRNLDHFRIARIDNGLMLEMPYARGELAMDVILPNAKDGIAALEKRFVEGAFAGWVAKLEDKRVDVTFPRFKTQASVELAKMLGAMGIKKAFTFPGADFSAIDGTHELFISKVIHQAFVAVDEEGTEAAAATAVMMEAGAAPPTEKPVVFRADHPFMVVIRDTRNGEPIFVGRIVDPSS